MKRKILFPLIMFSLVFFYFSSAISSNGIMDNQENALTASESTYGNVIWLGEDEFTPEGVQNVIDNEAESGYFIVLPEGEATWTKGVSIPDGKKITIFGHGVDENGVYKTKITQESGGYTFVLNRSGSRISGIHFHINNGQAIAVRGLDWRIDYCKFEKDAYPGGKGVYAYGNSEADGHPVGVVSHCEFINSKVLINGSLHLLANTIWAEETNLGENNAVFVEDCQFTHTIFGNCMDGNYGGRYVFRHNKVSGAYIEAHGLQSYRGRAIRSWEIYENEINDETRTPWCVTSLRGGTGVVFNNTVTGNFSNISLLLNIERDASPEISNCDGTHPWDGNTPGRYGFLCRDQPGAGQDIREGWDPDDPNQPLPPQSIEPVYEWGNTINDENLDFGIHSPGPQGNHLTEGETYFNNDLDEEIIDKPADYVPYDYPHPDTLIGPKSVNDLISNEDPSLVVHYPLEGSVVDESGNELDGTLLGGSYSQDCQEGNYSLDMDGTYGGVCTSDGPLLDITEAITIAAWVKAGAVGRDNYIAYKQGVFSLELTRSWTNRPQVYLYTTAGRKSLSGSTTIAVDTWYHLAVSYDIATQIIKLYVNGAKDASVTLSGSYPLIETDNPLYLGRPYWSRFFNGKIDDFKLFNTALSDEEISQLAQD